MFMQTESAADFVASSAQAIADRVFLGNPLGRWLMFGAVAAVVFLALVGLRRLLVRRTAKIAARTTTPVDDFLLALLRATRAYFLLLVALGFGLPALVLGDRIIGWLRIVFVVGGLLQVGLWGNAFVTFWARHYMARKAADLGSVTTINALTMVVRLVLWSLVLLVALTNLGIDVTALIGGLGIAGIAAALAVQSTLGDLFASLSIVVDKPFVVGDSIAVGDFSGTVEKVGLKTTRLRSQSGEQLILSNNDLLQSRIRNYKRMTERRAVFNFGVEYGTPGPELSGIPALVREIVEREKPVRFDRAHFTRFGPSSLDFEVVYWVLDPDYNLYMDIQQRINLALLASFRAMGVSFALPTQTMMVRDADDDGATRRQPRASVERPASGG
jgi:small-conductance mechanosensitive channel